MAQHEIDLIRREQIARGAGGLLGVDEPGGDDLAAELAHAFLHPRLIALDPLAQALELGPVGREADSEHTDAGGGGH